MARTTGDTKTSPLILIFYSVNPSNFCLPYIYEFKSVYVTYAS